MTRNKLKYGGKRNKALLGSDGALMAAATLTAAGMNVAATTAAAKQQAKAVEASSKVQSQALIDQNANNNELQEKSIEFTKEQNETNRQQMRDIQATLQMMAGQQNMNDALDAQKMQVKYGGRPKVRRKLRKAGKDSTPSYGGASMPFQVTDGGGVLPIATNNAGYGLYELYGNDHEHYHKAPGGKAKTGVGIKFANGGVVEGEGNQNTNQGELLYVTPEDAMFISKHSIKGFNPTKAVLAGMHPKQAFNIQEGIKDMAGLNDDGSKTKKAMYGGQNILIDTANLTQSPTNMLGPVAIGGAYADKNQVAKYGGRRQLKKCGGRQKAIGGYGYQYAHQGGIPKTFDIWNNPNFNFGVTATPPKTLPATAGSAGIVNTTTGTTTTTPNKASFWDNYSGAITNAGANLGAAAMGWIGNSIASNMLRGAYTNAANRMVDAYNQMHGIDLSMIKESNYEAPHALAAVRNANVNINPQIERIRRDISSKARLARRNTISSAAQLSALGNIQDAGRQAMSEQYAWKHNQEEQIKQQVNKTITEVANENANRDMQARQQYTKDMLAGMMYNNNIENEKLAGKAQALANAETMSADVTGKAMQTNMGLAGSALTTGAQGFTNVWNEDRAFNRNLDLVYATTDPKIVVDNIIRMGDKNRAKQAYDIWKNSNNPQQKEWAERIRRAGLV